MMPVLPTAAGPAGYQDGVDVAVFRFPSVAAKIVACPHPPFRFQTPVAVPPPVLGDIGGGEKATLSRLAHLELALETGREG